MVRPTGSEPNGGPRRIRTFDPRLRKPLLYPAELWNLRSHLRKWSVRQDSNLRPLGPKPSALPSCATHRLNPQRCSHLDAGGAYYIAYIPSSNTFSINFFDWLFLILDVCFLLNSLAKTTLSACATLTMDDL
jgi:hypothetical protein